MAWFVHTSSVITARFGSAQRRDDDQRFLAITPGRSQDTVQVGTRLLNASQRDR